MNAGAQFARRVTRPLLCLVTSRRRAAPAAASFAEEQRALVAQIAAAADAGVDLIHIREPDLEARDLCALVGESVAVTRGSGSRVVVNDRADIALASGADGVHLRASGPSVERVRALGPDGWLVGRSAHSLEELALAAEADYILFGTVFATDSKPGVAGQGTAALAAAVRRVKVPVLAIGGVTLDRAAACAEAGAAGVAAISLFLAGSRGAAGLRDVVRTLRQQFNTD